MKKSKWHLYSCMILLPGIVVLAFYALSGKVWNAPIIYLMVDSVILLISQRTKRHQSIREEAESQMEEYGEGVGQLKSKIDELKELE